jgi:deoxyribonucleoside regulator
LSHATSRFEPAGNDDRRAIALEMATLHYTRGKTMEAIAQSFGVSRSTVSRLLTGAREAGLVEIRIRPGQLGDSAVAAEIVDRYQLEGCIAVPAGSLSPAERFEATAARAANLIDSILESDMVIAVSWGTMVNALSLALKARNVVNCQIVQLNGFGNSISKGVHYSNQIYERFGEVYNAYVQQYPVPLFFDSNEVRDSLLRESSIARIRRLQHAADLVLFNVGTVEDFLPNSPYLAGYNVGAREVDDIRRDGVVGEIAATYFRADGSTSGVDINDRTSGPDLERLKSARYRICVTSGEHKVRALNAALQGGSISHLVIDTDTAASLLSLQQ